MKYFNESEVLELYKKTTNVHGIRNILFLGNNFDPEKNAELLKINWNTIFTTIIDESVIDKLLAILENNVRKVSLVSYNDAITNLERLSSGKNYVNIFDLKVICLIDDKLPDRRMQKNAEKIFEDIAVTYMKNYGILFCLGFSTEDKLKTETFLNALDDLRDYRNDECVYLFDADENLEKEFINQDKPAFLQISSQSLTELWKDYIMETDQDIWSEGELDSEENSYKIYIDGKPEFVPKENTKEINGFAKLLDFKTMSPAPKEKHKYRLWFASFLKNNSIEPKWYGYREGFYLHRKFHTALYNVVDESLKKPGMIKYRPILLHGQSGSGKSLALGELAYKIFHDRKFPVIYITKPNISFRDDSADDLVDSEKNFEKLKLFLKYLIDEKNAKSILLIWDCSGLDRERNNYRNLYDRLRNFGINVVLVGTSYLSLKNPDVKELFYDVQADIELSENDIYELKSLLKNKAKMEEGEREYIIEQLKYDIENNQNENNNFLALLYNVFWDIRDDLANGIRKELKCTINPLRENYDKTKNLGDNLVTMNFSKFKKLVSDVSDEETNKEKLENFIIFTSLFTYYNKEISLDFVYDLLNVNVELLIKILDAPIFVVNNYPDKHTYKIRTKLEAQMVLRTYGIEVVNGYEEIIKLLCKILYFIEKKRFGTAAISEAVELITKIISDIGPNSSPFNDIKWDSEMFAYYTPCFVAALFCARQTYCRDPRLMIQELTLTREYYNFNKKKKNDAESVSCVPYNIFKKIFDEVRSEEDGNGNKSSTEEKPDSAAENAPKKETDEFSRDYTEINYEPLLEEELDFAKKFVEENDDVDYGSVYIDHIKTDIANSYLELGKNETDLIDCADKACDLCDELIRKGNINNRTNMDNCYTVTVWLKAHNARIEYKKKRNEDITVLREEALSFAITALHYNPELDNDSYFINECKKLFPDNESPESLAEALEVNPTPAIVFCYAYSKCYESNLLSFGSDGAKWCNVEPNTTEYKKIEEIYSILKKNFDIISVDSHCLYLMLQLYWLKNNHKPLNFKDEKQHTAMSEENWNTIGTLCSKILDVADDNTGVFVYQCKYIQAIAYAELGNFEATRRLLKEVKMRLRYQKTITKHILCDSTGTPKKFSGIVSELPQRINSSGAMDLKCVETGKTIKKVFFNQYNLFQNRTQLPEKGARVDNLMLGIGYMGINALGYEEKDRKNV